MGDGDSAVGVVCKAEAKEAGGVAVEGDLIVLTHIGDDLVDVGQGVAENKCVIDIDDNVSCLSWCYAIEEALVKLRHEVPFCEQGGLVVHVEYTAGVGEAV